MQQRFLGQDKISVGAIGLGCMGMSEFYGETDDTESLATLARALELGSNFLDTADAYGIGDNETLIGRFLKEGGAARRDRIVLATKFAIVRRKDSPERRIDNSPAYIQSACEASLKRLGIETIDLYYCHRRNHDVPLEDVVGAMAALVKAGKVKQIGLSEVSPETLRQANAMHPIAAVQSEYSLWSRDPEQEMLKTCTELGTTFVAYSPLGRAFLTGTISTAALPKSDYRKNSPRFQGEAEAANRLLVDELSKFAEARHITNAQAALAWLLVKQPSLIPIPGARRLPHLEQNATAADVSLSASDIAELDRLFTPDKVVGARYPEAAMAGVE